ncbi:hypothetical protein LINPERHAP1_LOCUS25125 [Linum perenne]
MVFLGRVLTLDNLQARGFQLPNRCVLCLSQEESVNHLFICCPFASHILGLISSKLSIPGPLPGEVQPLIEGWKVTNFGNPFRELQKVVLHCVLWNIWLERNNRIFREESVSPHCILYRIWLSSCRWLKSFSIISEDMFEAWLRQLHSI